MDGRAQQVVSRGYDTLGPRYRDWSRAGPVRLGRVRELLRLLPDRGIVVDLGCGPGEPALRLLAERQRVVGVDLSAVQLSLARQAAPTATFARANMSRFALRPGSVDAVASFYAPGHLPPESHAPLRSIAHWLRPGGVLLTSAPLTDVDSGWLGVPIHSGGIGEQDTRDAVQAAGLRLTDAEAVEEEGDGHLVRFLRLTAVAPER